MDHTRSRINLLGVYLAWVEAWCRASRSQASVYSDALSIPEMARVLRISGANDKVDTEKLSLAMYSFRQRVKRGEIIVGGRVPPSCTETDLLSEQYDPRVNCSCNGVSPMSDTIDLDLGATQRCKSIARMLQAKQEVCARPGEWLGHGIFTAEKLESATQEIALCNTDIQDSPRTCSGADMASAPPVRAPDRRPSPECDTSADRYNALFPTLEKVKLCADAKYFYAMACGGSLVDAGILRAIADAGNDVLIGDYCEAATPEVLTLLQQTGAAALAFLKLCTLADMVDDWHLEILVAAHLHFKVLGYYRNHAVAVLPGGLYGSRMTELTSHRHIDIAHTVGIVAASLATGQRIDEVEYMKLSHGTTLLNDLVDFRSDIMRKQRENPVLRGVRGCLCEYLNKQLVECITCVTELIESKQLLAMTTMAFCNWAIMASHHKAYEVIHGTRRNEESPPCTYKGLDERYHLLLKVLEPYGTLGSDGPSWDKKRVDMDKLYSVYRQSSESHLAWLADAVRLLLEPASFRRIVDVVHYSWTGDVGDAYYCP